MNMFLLLIWNDCFNKVMILFDDVFVSDVNQSSVCSKAAARHMFTAGTVDTAHAGRWQKATLICCRPDESTERTSLNSV